PSACERSRTLTPDSTETGPVGGAAGGALGSRRCASGRACRWSRGRAAPWSITTRRRRPPPAPPRGRSGRFGLLPPLAMGRTSVKATQLRPDADLLPQDAREHAAFGRALEAREAAARIGTAPRFRSTHNEDAVAGREAEQLALRRLPAAAPPGPQRLPRRYSSALSDGSTSIGIPSVGSSSAARCGSGTIV